MNPRLLLLPAAALAFASCSQMKGNENYDTAQGANYDTSNPYGVPDAPGTATAGETAPYQAVEPVNPPANSNPTYGKAAYEETATAATAAPKTTGSKPVAGAANGAARTHEVVKGDTLSGIAKKYGVTQASIKTANNMTKDTVVLGKKMIIPAH